MKYKTLRNILTFFRCRRDKLMDGIFYHSSFTDSAVWFYWSDMQCVVRNFIFSLYMHHLQTKARVLLKKTKSFYANFSIKFYSLNNAQKQTAQNSLYITSANNYDDLNRKSEPVFIYKTGLICFQCRTPVVGSKIFNIPFPKCLFSISNRVHKLRVNKNNSIGPFRMGFTSELLCEATVYWLLSNRAVVMKRLPREQWSPHWGWAR